MKVFVDGIEVANPTTAAVDPNSIERIEVIRGPQAAAIYGSDAIGGVIQIFTKRGDPTLSHPRWTLKPRSASSRPPMLATAACSARTTRRRCAAEPRM